MSPVVVADFTSLTEAQIACGALRAEGLDAEVLDQNFGSVMPTGLVGRFRLVVPDDEAAGAKRLLAEIAAGR